MTRSGIPTEYRSQRFRSRLEARWAAFFDLVGWRWTYEPFDTDGWIPDFLIHGAAPFLVEVGPCITHEDYIAKAEKPLRAQGEFTTLVLGVCPTAPHPSPAYDDFSALGLMVGSPTWGIKEGMALAVRCECIRRPTSDMNSCGDVGIFHDYGHTMAHPCGHYPGGHAPGSPITRDALDSLWRRAGNDVQWRP